MRTFARRAAIVGALLLGASAAGAQDAPPAAGGAEAAPPAVGEWVTRVKLGLSLTQSSFTKNWAGSETGTVSWLAVGDFAADSQIRPRLKLTNALILAFGQTHQQDAARSVWLVPTKSADKIKYDGVARFTLGGWVDPFIALNVDTEFFQKVGDVSEILTPLTIGESVGMARAFYDTKTRSLVSRLGFAVRQKNDRFAVAPVEARTDDGGFEWRTTGRFASEGDKTVFKSQLTAFQAVFFSGSDQDPQDHWKTLDVRWENGLSNKINKWMSVDVYLEYLFDEQLNKAGQLKETLGIGVTAQL